MHYSRRSLRSCTRDPASLIRMFAFGKIQPKDKKQIMRRKTCTLGTPINRPLYKLICQSWSEACKLSALSSACVVCGIGLLCSTNLLMLGLFVIRSDIMINR